MVDTELVKTSIDITSLHDLIVCPLRPLFYFSELPLAFLLLGMHNGLGLVS